MTRQPFVRIAKRAREPRSAWAIRIAAIAAALLFGGLIILLLGHNPFSVYPVMFGGALGNKLALRETVKISIPLLGAAVAIAPAFKMKFWNIGAEGQIMAGAIAASYFALYWYDKVPQPVLLIIMFLAGALAGGLWGLIPAFFRAKWGTNETLFTLMLNYVALQFELYLQNGPWKDSRGTGFPKIPMFNDAARLPKLLGVHIGWIIVLVFVAAMFVYMRYTKDGYEIAVVGESERTAQYAGISVTQVTLKSMAISGAVSGAVGFLVVSGANYTLSDQTAGGVGFTAIAVAWLSKLNPIVMVAIAFFLAILSKGSNTIQTAFEIPKSAAEVLTGVILFFMLACEFFVEYKLIFRQKSGGAAK
ncbi:MAG: ABC transporter permease [Oscillospiraceae bacterium]|jgi:simple sugar transport system permease protein|nr:ABC transporter permease [Oscillospiraceae bacterium]